MIDNLIRAGICRITCGLESGTGFLIAHEKLLTARHCIYPAISSGEKIDVSFHSAFGGRTVQASIHAESAELDVCVLTVPHEPEAPRIPIKTILPREGIAWQSYGYPKQKGAFGHRITGIIGQALGSPVLGADLDLSVDLTTALSAYQGLSGAPLISEGANWGVIRLKIDGGLCATSFSLLERWLIEIGIIDENEDDDSTVDVSDEAHLATRDAFHAEFLKTIKANPGKYIFLEGAHGIGKSTFCRSFTSKDEHLINLGTYSLSATEDNRSIAYRVEPEVFFDWLISVIAGVITGHPTRKEQGQSYTAMVDAAAVALKAFSQYCESRKGRGLMFIDGLNDGFDTGTNLFSRFIGLLPEILPQNITIVLVAPNFQTAIRRITSTTEHFRFSMWANPILPTIYSTEHWRWTSIIWPPPITVT